MESAVHHELTRATYKILRAHEFTRSSSAATDVIVHLVSRFLELVATSSGEYTQLAGRSTVNVFDCMNALDEMGWDLEETLRWCNTDGPLLASYRPGEPSPDASTMTLAGVLNELVRMQKCSTKRCGHRISQIWTAA